MKRLGWDVTAGMERKGPTSALAVAMDKRFLTGEDWTQRLWFLQQAEAGVEQGFQLTTQQGPMCEEPLMGVAFVLEEVTCLSYDAFLSPHKGVDPFGPIQGQVIRAAKDGFRRALECHPRRLVEALYRVEFQCVAEIMGKLYGEVTKRRGKIVSEEIREGTSYFNVVAHLPVATSFGFAGDVRKKTGGIANPMLTFSHWAVIPVDPFFVPRTEDEIEEFGAEDRGPNLAKDIVNAVRTRKGLFVEKKVVAAPEKQRTLAKKK